MGGLGENQGFLKDSNILASAVNYRSIFLLLMAASKLKTMNS